MLKTRTSSRYRWKPSTAVQVKVAKRHQCRRSPRPWHTDSVRLCLENHTLHKNEMCSRNKEPESCTWMKTACSHCFFLLGGWWETLSTYICTTERLILKLSRLSDFIIIIIISLPLAHKHGNHKGCKCYWKGRADVWNVAEMDNMGLFRNLRTLSETLRTKECIQMSHKQMSLTF